MNISNKLTIGSDITLMSDGLKEQAKELGLWDPKQDGPFDFTLAYSADSPGMIFDIRFLYPCFYLLYILTYFTYCTRFLYQFDKI